MLLKQKASLRRTTQGYGFSLTELMIVVAIMGILLAISVPSFRRYQLQAYQSEAKTELSALYTANTAFKLEWGTYYGNFVVIGYRPKGELAYLTGFYDATPCTNGCWGECGSGAMAITNATKIKAPEEMGSTTIKELDYYYGFDKGDAGNSAYVSLINTSSHSSKGACQGKDSSGMDEALGCNYVGPNTFDGGTSADVVLSNSELNSKTCATTKDFLAASVGMLQKDDQWTINESKSLENIQNGLSD